MCFSAEVSLATLSIGLVGSTAVYTLGTVFDRIVAFFIGYVSLMQGIEWVLWNNQSCNSFHKNTSILGMLLNAGQPIVLGILTLLMSSRATYYKLYIIPIMLLYSIIVYIYFTQYKNNLQCTTPRPNDPHLVWNWTILPYYYLYWSIYIVTVVLIALLGMPTLNSGILFAGATTVSMITSILVYPRQDMGAMWCFFAAFTPIAYYGYRTLI